MVAQLFLIGPALSPRADLIGGKAVGLGHLARAGANVPPGVVVSVSAHTGHPDSVSAIVQLLLRQLPREAKSLSAAKLYAVRSSNAAEDSESASYAGVFTTTLNVPLKDMAHAVSACIASYSSTRVASYERLHGLNGDRSVVMAVVVQEMLAPRCAGVAFSCHPTTGDSRYIAIEAVPGLGESLVSGRVTPDWYLLDRKSGYLIDFEPGDATNGTAVLDRADLEKVSRLTTKMHGRGGTAVDIEFAFEESTLYALQLRPVTARLTGD